MSEPKPPNTKIELRPGESVWEAMTRELASNPDSPSSLNIMSAVNKAIKPRAQAVDQVVDAMAAQLQHDGQSQRAAVQAAIGHWERACGAPMEPDIRAGLQKTAVERATQARRKPPKIGNILTSVPTVTDTGYRLGIHLQGLEGTWHRLWAIMCLAVEFDGDVAVDEGVMAVRAQFEELLGRKLLSAEWEALTAHVKARFESDG